MVDHHGIGGGPNGGPIYNCCSYGALHQIGAVGSRTRTAVISRANDVTFTNCYYLNGIEADTTITPETGAIAFYQTSDDANAMTTARVVDELNDYIESNPEAISTVGWCQWVISDDNFPVLDFNKEWDGENWVTVNDTY